MEKTQEQEEIKKKKKPLNARQKKFCLLRASGMKQIEAYKKAGYEEAKSNPSMLESKEEIKQEINRLQERAEEQSFDLAKEFQAYAPELVNELIGLVRQKKAPQVKVRAIQEAFDRGFGKPRETIDTGVTILWDIKRKELPGE
jgi:phage terminase small subunit